MLSVGALLFVLALVTGGVERAAAKNCYPYTLPSGQPTFQHYCGVINDRSNNYYESLFAKGKGPYEYGEFPLNSSVLGCLAGSGSVTRADILNMALWSGKKFYGWNKPKSKGYVQNILSPSNAMENYDWTSDNFPVYLYFEGEVTRLSKAVVDDGKSVWRINYETSALSQAVNPYSTLVASTLDELRVVNDRMVVGRTWAKPQTTLNPTSSYVNEGVYFVLFQVCTHYGNYADNPSDRFLGSTGSTKAPPPPPPGGFYSSTLRNAFQGR